MFELFVGDVDQSLADQAIAHSKDAVLITSANVNDFLTAPTRTAYSSLGDIDNIDIFFQLCILANKIYYRPPICWSDSSSDSKSKQLTEQILAGLSQSVPVDGIDKIIDQKKYFNKDFLQDHRKVSESQLWVAGCSITNGTGVSKNQTFKEIIAQKLKLEYSDLSRSGSSIIWQSDQITRSNLQPNDIVVWGLTSPNRLPVFDQDIVHLSSSQYQQSTTALTKFPIELLDNTTLMYHNILAVKRVHNFCKKIGVQLVILGLMYDFYNNYLYYDVPTFRQLMFWPKKYPDVGTDGKHPGPESHQMFAKEFFELYSKLYSADLVAKT
jgi:hypothetical protein